MTLLRICCSSPLYRLSLLSQRLQELESLGTGSPKLSTRKKSPAHTEERETEFTHIYSSETALGNNGDRNDKKKKKSTDSIKNSKLVVNDKKHIRKLFTTPAARDACGSAGLSVKSSRSGKTKNGDIVVTKARGGTSSLAGRR